MTSSLTLLKILQQSPITYRTKLRHPVIIRTPSLQPQIPPSWACASSYPHPGAHSPSLIPPSRPRPHLGHATISHASKSLPGTLSPPPCNPYCVEKFLLVLKDPGDKAPCLGILFGALIPPVQQMPPSHHLSRCAAGGSALIGSSSAGCVLQQEPWISMGMDE